MSEITYNIRHDVDYITVSSDDFKVIDDMLGTPQKTHSRLRNYDMCWVYECGLLHHKHSTNPKMKNHLTLSGITLETMRGYGFSDKKILQWLFWLKNPKFGRVDIAVTSTRTDGGKHEIDPHFIHIAALYGWCETKLKLDNPVTNSELGVETCYIGSRKARNTLVRVYDKGLQSGGRAGEIVRVELERRKNAQKLAVDVMSGGHIGSLIRKRVDFPQFPAWVKVMGDDVAKDWRSSEYFPTEYDKQKAENDSRWDWLYTSVIPAMSKAIAFEGGDMEKIDRFNELLQSAVAIEFEKRNKS